MDNKIVLLVAFVFFVGLAGLFGGSETGMYQLSKVRLRLGVEKKKFLFVVLERVMKDSPSLLLTTLVGSNLAHYFATSIITYMFFVQTDVHSAEASATLVAVPLLFVFSELIPKNIFFHRSDFLMPYAAPVLYIAHKLFSWCGAVPLLRVISGGFGRLAGLSAPSKTPITSGPRHRILALLRDTHEEGILSPIQTDMLNRVVAIPGTRIRSVMIPLGRVESVEFNSDRASLLSRLEKCPFTRLLVYRRRPSNIVGFVDIYETLSGSRDFNSLAEYVRQIRKLDENTTVTEAIHVMQSEGHKIILVTRRTRGRRQRPVGIVTMKDLAEELLGELSGW